MMVVIMFWLRASSTEDNASSFSNQHHLLYLSSLNFSMDWKFGFSVLSWQFVFITKIQIHMLIVEISLNGSDLIAILI